MLAYVVLAAGFCLLALGGETSLRGAIGLAKIVRLPPLFIGLVVVTIGSTLPALSVALHAAAQGSADIAVSSLVGQNIFNVVLALGLAALVRSVPCPPKVVFRDGGTLLIASLTLVLMGQAGLTTLRTGIILLVGFVIYCVLTVATDWRRPVTLSLVEIRALSGKPAQRAFLSTILFLFGLVCIYFGGQFTVVSAIAIARIDQVPEVVLGLTLVAAVSGFPALLTTFVASARGMTNVIGGQLIAASALNILFVLGLTTFLFPLSIPREVAQMDAYVAAASGGVVVTMMLPGWRITRGQGVILLVCYAGYLALLAWRQGLLPL